LEISADLRQVRAQPFSHEVHVGKATQAMIFVKAHLHDGRAGTRIRIEDRVEPRGRADVGNNDLKISFRNYLPHDILNLANHTVGHFQARAGGRLDADDELTWVGSRKVRFANKRI